MEEKLDDFNKILLATGVINYMASALNGVNMQIKCVPLPKLEDDFSERVIKNGIKERDEALQRVVKELCAIVESFGNFIDSRDCICHLDTRVYQVPLEILLHGMDDVEKDYSETTNNE